MQRSREKGLPLALPLPSGAAALALAVTLGGCWSCGSPRGGDGAPVGGDGSPAGGDGSPAGGDGATIGGDGGAAPADAGSVPPDGGVSCGDDVLEAPEQCDGADLGGQTCLSVATVLSGGTLGCTLDCRFDTSGCSAMPVNPPLHDFNGDGFDDFVVGVPFFGYAAGTFVGAGIVYFGGPGLVTGAAPAGIAAGTVPEANAGREIAAAGDVNTDGFGDVLVARFVSMPPLGAPDVTDLFYGGAGATFDVSADLALAPALTPSYGFQTSSAGVGDVNGDGHDDVALASWSNAAAWVFLGGPAGPDATADATLGAGCGGSFGESIAGAGDVNGDGFADIVAGAPGGGADCSYPAGMACLWFGGPGSTFDEVVDGIAPYDCSTGGGAFGESVASAGDVNGDGFDDIVAGQRITGDAHLFFGGPGASFDPAVDAVLDVEAGVHVTVASAGDLNGDGFDDLAVGAPSDPAFEPANPGHVYVYFGGPGAFDPVPDLVLAGTVAASLFGMAVSSPGDVDGDGYDDLLVGAPSSLPGRVFVFLGGAGTSMDAVPDVVLDGDSYDGFGTRID